MKHGPIALIDDGVPVVVLAPKGPGYEKVLSNLAEVKARNGHDHRGRDQGRHRDRGAVRARALDPRRAARRCSRS